jgi:hypothetical protein
VLSSPALRRFHSTSPHTHKREPLQLTPSAQRYPVAARAYGLLPSLDLSMHPPFDCPALIRHARSVRRHQATLEHRILEKDNRPGILQADTYTTEQAKIHTTPPLYGLRQQEPQASEPPHVSHLGRTPLYKMQQVVTSHTITKNSSYSQVSCAVSCNTASISRDRYQPGILNISQDPTACKPRAELARHPAAFARYSRTQLTVLLPWYACMPASLQGSHLVPAAAPKC